MTDTEKFMKRKKATMAEDLCEGFPGEFVTYIRYTRDLGFEQEPDYEFLKGLLKKVAEKNNFVFDNDWDWVKGKAKLNAPLLKNMNTITSNVANLNTETSNKNDESTGNNKHNARILGESSDNKNNENSNPIFSTINSNSNQDSFQMKKNIANEILKKTKKMKIITIL